MMKIHRFSSVLLLSCGLVLASPSWADSSQANQPVEQEDAPSESASKEASEGDAAGTGTLAEKDPEEAAGGSGTGTEPKDTSPSDASPAQEPAEVDQEEPQRPPRKELD
ncbi:MAG: hypothetical protein IJ441_11555, partial [Spirochaetaceae bacterium]|nr:hypothetical protein [Spirochaetaceae bacterium]